MLQQCIQVGQNEGIQLINQHIKCFKMFSFKKNVFILCKISIQWREKSFLLTNRKYQYICHLQRQLNSHYKQSLQQLIKSIDYGSVFQIQNYWFGLFKIYAFPFEIIKQYNICNATYGEEIVINYRQNKQYKVMSNCFQQNKHYFYFANHEDSSQHSQMSQMISIKEDKIFGFGIIIGRLYFCLPIQVLLDDLSPPLSIMPNIQPNLSKVAFVSYKSSHCTGLLLAQNLIVTVRHLFDNLMPELGTIVDVRIFPYKQHKKAKLAIKLPNFIDFVVLQITSEQKPLEKIALSQQLLKNTNTIPSLKQGGKIYAIGFGKYSYQNNLFNHVDLLLPTITYGVISKVITHQNKQVYFKTDSYLYNGYSGCPIWNNGNWIGNSVFIIKNTVSSNKHPNHNFNYCLQFIYFFLLTKHIENLASYEQFITQFQKIHTRKTLKLKANL